MNNHNAPIQMDTSSSQQHKHQHQQQHPSGIGLNEVLSLIQTQDDMRELLIRDGRLLPSKKSALSSNAYYRGVFQGVLVSTHDTCPTQDLLQTANDRMDVHSHRSPRHRQRSEVWDRPAQEELP